MRVFVLKPDKSFYESIVFAIEYGYDKQSEFIKNSDCESLEKIGIYFSAFSDVITILAVL